MSDEQLIQNVNKYINEQIEAGIKNALVKLGKNPDLIEDQVCSMQAQLAEARALLGECAEVLTTKNEDDSYYMIAKLNKFLGEK